MSKPNHVWNSSFKPKKKNRGLLRKTLRTNRNKMNNDLSKAWEFNKSLNSNDVWYKMCSLVEVSQTDFNTIIVFDVIFCFIQHNIYSMLTHNSILMTLKWWHSHRLLYQIPIAFRRSDKFLCMRFVMLINSHKTYGDGWHEML